MIIKISRFNSHQTAKVLGIITTISSLILFFPLCLLMAFSTTQSTSVGMPYTVGSMIGFGIIMPIFQGLFMYLFIRFSLWIYNKLFKKIGGIEFETLDNK